MDSRPACTEFIIATIRNIRVNPSNLKEGTKGGVSLNRLHEVISQLYSDDEIRSGLNQLLSKKILVAIWYVGHASYFGGVNVVGWRYGFRDENLAMFAPDFPFGIGANDYFYRTDIQLFSNGKPAEEDKNHLKVMRVLLYVVSDGIPERVAKIAQPKFKNKAEEVLASMQRSG